MPNNHSSGPDGTIRRAGVLFAIVMLLLLMLTRYSGAQETIVKAPQHRSTVLDRGVWLNVFHAARRMLFEYINSTPYTIVPHQYQSAMDLEFPCDTRQQSSATVPESVHRLRPGDIKVIAAIGDSLTVGSGATATSFQQLFMECRGMSWCIGGQWTWHNATTLPNILREFNPALIGYSRGNALPVHADTQLNLAEIGAGTADMPAMTRAMVHRIRRDRRIDFRHDWKLVTTLIGGNDVCSYVCMMDDPRTLPAVHRQNMLKSLRYMRDHLPRTFVNVVSAPLVKTVVDRKNKSPMCDLIHLPECSCWLGRLYNQSEAKRQRFHQIQLEMRAVEAEVAEMDEFQNLTEFAVVHQPFSWELSLKTDASNDDTSLLAYDCFHMSQKGHAWAGVSLWNNMLEPPGKKSRNWSSPHKKFRCPTKQFPYIYTNNNFNVVSTDSNDI